MNVRGARTTVPLSRIVSVLGAEVILNPGKTDPDVPTVCGADLMSDVMAFSNADSLLLTGLTTPQVIFTAEMADIRVICFIRGKVVQNETVALAEAKNMILLQTRLPMFDSCGRLYELGLRGCFHP